MGVNMTGEGVSITGISTDEMVGTGYDDRRAVDEKHRTT
jgi:hypothetical protein